MNKKFWNIFFVFFTFFLIIGIGIFNYFVDPYNERYDNGVNDINLYNRDMYAITLKLSKYKKYKTVVIGGSSIRPFSPHLIIDNPGNIFYITVPEIPIETIKNYLEFFLLMHPEVENIIVPIEYNSFFIEYNNDFPIINNKNLTPKEIHKYFLSYDTTRLSIQKLIDRYTMNKKTSNKINIVIPLFVENINAEIISKIINIINNIFSFTSENEGIEIINFLIKKFIDPIIDNKFPNYTSLKTQTTDKYNFLGTKTIFNRKKDILAENQSPKSQSNTYNIFNKAIYFHMNTEIIDNFKYYDEIFDIVKKHNVKPIIIVLPYNTLFYAIMEKKDIYKYRQEINKYFLTKSDTIIDFSIINKYTSMPVEKSYLYQDICHPVTRTSNLWGHLLRYLSKYNNIYYNIIFLKKYVQLSFENDYNNVLYNVITKESIDEISLKEEIKLNEYISENRDRITKLMQEKKKSDYISIYEDKLVKMDNYIVEEAFTNNDINGNQEKE